MGRKLKSIAEELYVPMVVLASVEKSVEDRPDKRPRISDLSTSDIEIARASDTILLLYRDEVYNKKSEDAGVMEVILAKNGRGDTGTVKVAFDYKTSRVGAIQVAGI